MTKATRIFLLLWFSSQMMFSLTCTLTSTGTWQTNGNWSCGISPPCGATIVIPAGYTVTINNIQNYSGCATPLVIHVYGEMVFNGGKLRMSSNSEIYVYSGGRISETGPGSGNSSTIEISGSTLWNADSPPVSGPSSLPVGLLPIELTYFNAKTNADRSIGLTWETTTEINNSFFTVERSNNGNNFQEIGKIQGAGNSTSVLHYEWTDKHPLSSMAYYRLKQTDFNGEFSYSGIVAVQALRNELRLIAYPNPSDGDMHVVIPEGFNSSDNEIKLTVCDIHGKPVIESMLDYTGKETTVELSLAKGCYHVSVEAGTSKISRTVIIQ